MRVALSIAVVLVVTGGCSTFLSDRGDGPGDAGDSEAITLTPDDVEVMDTWLYEGYPNNTYGQDFVLQCDANHQDEGSSTGQAVGLLRFDLAGGEIPATADLISATLRLAVQDHGEAGLLMEVLTSWDESTTWNSFGSDPGLISAIDFVPSPVATVLTNGFQDQVIEVDVTNSITAWLAGERENRGWLFLCSDDDGSALYTHEADPARWPALVLELRR